MIEQLYAFSVLKVMSVWFQFVTCAVVPVSQSIRRKHFIARFASIKADAQADKSVQRQCGGVDYIEMKKFVSQ